MNGLNRCGFSFGHCSTEAVPYATLTASKAVSERVHAVLVLRPRVGGRVGEGLKEYLLTYFEVELFHFTFSQS